MKQNTHRTNVGCEKFETAHGTGSISIWEYLNGGLAIEVEAWTQTACPHKQIKTFCTGRNKTEVIFNFAELLRYSFEIEAINYAGKRGLENDLLYAKLPNPRLYIPLSVKENVLDKLENLERR